MRYCLSSRIPEPASILLVESGSRGIIESVIPGLRHTWGEDVPIDLISCYATLPQGFEAATTRIYRVADYKGGKARAELVRRLRGNQYSLMGIVCSGEPLMTKWKLALAWQLPAKLFIINENADYFWLDLGHSKQLRRFALARAGLAGTGAVRTLARVIAFPFTLAYLLLFAVAVHTRRLLRRGIAAS
jgi:hypothetical protein